MVLKMALYGPKSSGAAIRAKLESILYDIGYTPSKSFPDVLIRPEIKSDRTGYHEYSLVYVDNVLVIICFPSKKIEGITCVFKHKETKQILLTCTCENHLGKSKQMAGPNIGRYLPKKPKRL